MFSKIVDSSIWAEPDDVVKVFITMLALKDYDHVVRFNAFALGQRSHKTEAQVLEALKVLSSPDKTRLEPQPFEGRRIGKVSDGWLILNGAFYEAEMKKINRRAYKSQWQRDKRSEGKVSEAYMASERRFLKAEARGDQQAADNEAATPLKNGHNK